MSNLHISHDTPQEIKRPLEQMSDHLKNCNIHIHITTENITLNDQNSNIEPLTLSFTSQKSLHLTNTQQKQPLLKAINIKKKPTKKTTIVDLTAGFGKDSLILSTLKHPLISVEKNPITAAVLKTLVAQYKQINPQCQWEVICACSIQWLKQQQSDLTHLYLDPFFTKKTTALPKKDMQWLHYLNTHEQPSNENELFITAYNKSQDRVIVKRDKKATFIADKKPNQGSIMQKTSRFDCYKV
ncbi:MAG: class I SAM-dependent methyltransferase [Pseudomonadota bacterium]|nr:class I SAM-dependent methyltransferase [Pseudomonadota bacterium]